MIVRKTVSIVSPSAQMCIDNFAPPLLLSVPRDSGLAARKTGCPLSPNLIIIDSATLHHFPCGLSLLVEYHFVSDPGPKNDQVLLEFFANGDTSVELAMHSRFMVFISPYDVIEHRHEDNSFLELFGFAHFVHELLDITDKLQCGESLENVSLEFSVDCVQSSVL